LLRTLHAWDPHTTGFDAKAFAYQPNEDRDADVAQVQQLTELNYYLDEALC
jgi:hypothetical protein